VISVITITGIGDHLQPVWLITFTRMRSPDTRQQYHVIALAAARRPTAPGKIAALEAK
jgi:hypothetical protein